MTILFPHIIHAMLLAGAADSSCCFATPLGGFAEVDCGRCSIEVRAHIHPYQDSLSTFVHTVTTGGGRVRVYLPAVPYCSVRVTNTSHQRTFVDTNAHIYREQDEQP
jgi:hypothetical protein